MYVTPTTTLEEIKDEIRKINDQLYNPWLDAFDRRALEDELDYLESFIPVETW